MQELEDLKIIHTQKTDYQTIRLYEDLDKKIVFTLDTYVQFKQGKDEEIYHENLTKHAFELNKEAHDYLILGGGDGLVARNIYNLNNMADVCLVDIDDQVMELFNTDERLLKINCGSLKHCNIQRANALKWVPECQKKFDIIILDFPDPTNETLEQLYTAKFLKQIIDLLNQNGVISIQCNLKIQNEVLKNIRTHLNNVKVIGYEMPWLGQGCVIIGQLNC